MCPHVGELLGTILCTKNKGEGCGELLGAKQRGGRAEGARKKGSVAASSLTMEVAETVVLDTQGSDMATRHQMSWRFREEVESEGEAEGVN